MLLCPFADCKPVFGSNWTSITFRSHSIALRRCCPHLTFVGVWLGAVCRKVDVAVGGCASVLCVNCRLLTRNPISSSVSNQRFRDFLSPVPAVTSCHSENSPIQNRQNVRELVQGNRVALSASDVIPPGIFALHRKSLRKVGKTDEKRRRQCRRADFTRNRAENAEKSLRVQVGRSVNLTVAFAWIFGVLPNFAFKFICRNFVCVTAKQVVLRASGGFARGGKVQRAVGQSRGKQSRLEKSGKCSVR